MSTELLKTRQGPALVLSLEREAKDAVSWNYLRPNLTVLLCKKMYLNIDY